MRPRTQRSRSRITFIERDVQYAAFGEDVFDDNLLLMHVIIVADNKLVPVGTWGHARTHAIASRQATKVGHVTEGEPAGGLLGVELCVDLGAHAAVIGDVVELPAGHSGDSLDDVQTFVVAIRTFTSDADAVWVSVACGVRVQCSRQHIWYLALSV